MARPTNPASCRDAGTNVAILVTYGTTQATLLADEPSFVPAGCSSTIVETERAAERSDAVMLTLAPSRLCPATAIVIRDGLLQMVFHASLARSATELRPRVATRFGASIAEAADVRVGFDAGHPLVSSAVARYLEEAARWPDRDVPLRVDVNLERHFDADSSSDGTRPGAGHSAPPVVGDEVSA